MAELALSPALVSHHDRFGWFVHATSDALLALTGIPIRDFFLDPTAGVEAFRRGRPMLAEIFGPDVAPPPICTPIIKYGHINTLGAMLNFPAGGQVHHVPLFDSVDEGVRALGRPVDFAAAGMTPFFLDYRRRLQDAFAGEPVHFGWQWEGPITTGWEMLGERFMYDLFDRPAEIDQLLRLATASIVEYLEFFARVEGMPVVRSIPDNGRLCDDIAAMVPPRLWPRFVLPCWDLFFAGPVPARRVHCEDVRPEQLAFLDQLRLAGYDPGISPKLDPRIIKAGTRVKFGWRLGSFHYRSMTCQDVRDFVYQAAADGASYAFTYVAGDMCDDATVAKVHTFIAAAKECREMVARGVSREAIGEQVTPAGRERFWGKWRV